MTSRDHVKKVSYDLIGENPLPCAHFAKFTSKKSCGREDRMLFYFVNRTTWLRLMLLCWLEPLTLSNHSVTFDPYISCESGDVTFLFCNMPSRGHISKGKCDLISRNPST